MWEIARVLEIPERCPQAGIQCIDYQPMRGGYPMGGIGSPELMVICIIALLLFGPKRLPEVGKALGQAIRDFKACMEGKNDIPARPKTTQARLSCPDCGKSAGANAAFCAHSRAALTSIQRER